MKAQGLPISTLVIGALALLVLIAVSTMWVTGGGNIFQGFAQVTGGTTPSDLSQAKTVCKSYCADLQNIEPTYEQTLNHKFCTKTFDVSDAGGGNADRCFDSDSIAEECAFVASDGRTHMIRLHQSFDCNSQSLLSPW